MENILQIWRSWITGARKLMVNFLSNKLFAVSFKWIMCANVDCDDLTIRGSMPLEEDGCFGFCVGRCICCCCVGCKCTKVETLIERPLTQSQRRCMQLSWLFLWHIPEGVAKQSFLDCNHQSTCMPSNRLYVQLLWYIQCTTPEGWRLGQALCSDRSLIVYKPPLRIRTQAAGFRIISGDHYTTLPLWLGLYL